MELHYPNEFRKEGESAQRIVITSNQTKKERRKCIRNGNFTIVDSRRVEVNEKTLPMILYHIQSSEKTLSIKNIQRLIPLFLTSPKSEEEEKEEETHKPNKSTDPYLKIDLIECSDISELDDLEHLALASPPIFISKNSFDTWQLSKFIFDCPRRTDVPFKHNCGSLKKFAKLNDKRSRYLFMNLRHYLFNHFQQDDMEHILVFSSFTLWVHGIRKMNDIDLMIYQPFDELSAETQLAVMPFVIFRDRYFKGEVNDLIHQTLKRLGKPFMSLLGQWTKEESKETMSLEEIKDLLYSQIDITTFIRCLKILCSFSFGHTTFLSIITDIGAFWENDKHWFHAMDFSIRGTDMWPHYWDSYLVRWAKTHYLPSQSFDSIIYDNRYYAWFLGVKHTTLKTDIVRRILRARPSSMTDLIHIQDIVWWSIIPPIPTSYTDYKKTLYLSSDDIGYWKTQGYQLGENGRELFKSVKVCPASFVKTIQSKSKQRYGKDYSIAEIEDEIPTEPLSTR